MRWWFCNQRPCFSVRGERNTNLLVRPTTEAPRSAFFCSGPGVFVDYCKCCSGQDVSIVRQASGKWWSVIEGEGEARGPEGAPSAASSTAFNEDVEGTLSAAMTLWREPIACTKTGGVASMVEDGEVDSCGNTSV